MKIQDRYVRSRLSDIKKLKDGVTITDDDYIPDISSDISVIDPLNQIYDKLNAHKNPEYREVMKQVINNEIRVLHSFKKIVNKIFPNKSVEEKETLFYECFIIIWKWHYKITVDLYIQYKDNMSLLIENQLQIYISLDNQKIPFAMQKAKSMQHSHYSHGNRPSVNIPPGTLLQQRQQFNYLQQQFNYLQQQFNYLQQQGYSPEQIKYQQAQAQQRLRYPSRQYKPILN